MRKVASLTACAAAVASLVTAAPRAVDAQEDVYRWNVPLIWTPPHHVRTEQEAFRERVLELTGGKVDISLFQFGELGLVDSDVLSIVRGGEFPLAELDNSKTAGDEPLFQIFNLPGLAFSIKDSMTIAEATKELRAQALDEWNAVEVGMAHYNPPQGIFTKTPVASVEDLKGVSIRVYSGVLLSSFELLGASPQLIPWGDTPAALLQGVVDGAITSPSSGIDAGFADTVKYMTVMPLSNRVSWVMNKDVWQSLSPEIQDILRAESNATAERIQAVWNQQEAGVGELVEGAGMTFNPPSAEFQATVTELLRPVWDEWAASTKYGPEALGLALKALGRD
jgi:TRAP-type C4-dicarboxylate transport system substrate-binding protein